MSKLAKLAVAAAIIGITTFNLWAGGSGLNVVIVVNQNSTNSVLLGNYYRSQRQVPPQNVLRINWTGTNTEWSLKDFTSTLLNPFLAMLTSRQLTNQIDYVVLSMDIPYRVNGSPNGYSSTTSALFYGFKNDPGAGTCEIAPSSANLYAASEGIFRATPPVSANSNSFLVTMITADNLAHAETVVHQGAISDGTFPTQTVWLGKSTDADRNVRFAAFDNPVFNTRLRGNYSVMRTNIENPIFPGLILGYENGTFLFSIPAPPVFVPGAMADNITSFSGDLFEAVGGATTALRFLTAGVSGSYGTIIEPCAFQEKFPDPQNYFYQSRGFSLAECYYQSITNPYQGVVLGEPLAAPFAQPGTGSWNGLITNAMLAGTTNLSVQFTALGAHNPIQQVDLFIDGNWLQTITNIPPRSGNVLSVTLNGFATSFTVPASATIKSVTTGLVGVLNGTIYQNSTKVAAFAHGDRIELQSTAGVAKTGSQISVSVNNTTSSGALTTFIHASEGNPTTFLDSIASGVKAYELSGTLNLNAHVTLTVTKVNNSVITVSVTNTTSGNTIANFTAQLITAINNTTSLQGTDGLTAGDLQMNGDGSVAIFNLTANAAGFAAAQIKGSLTATTGLAISVNSGAITLTDNLTDLQPRNHLYLTAGTSNLSLTFPFNSASQIDGYHELAAVAYEGSHVHTQTRATQDIIIKNTTLSATFTPVVSNSAVQFNVAASANNISTIQLFSTGGLLATVSSQSNATFSVNLATLGLGSHLFYAIVTDSNGHQYRTQTENVSFITVNSPSNKVPLVILARPLSDGPDYAIQSTTNLLSSFQTRAVITPASDTGQWVETNTSPAQQYYRAVVAP